MVKRLSILILFLVSLAGHSQIERDKALHFLGGHLYGLAGAGIAKQISDGDRAWTFVGAVAGSALIGVAKEAVDAGQRPNGWDNEDLLATVLGGISVGLMIEIFTKKRDRYDRAELSSVQTEPFGLNPIPDITFENGELPNLNALGFTTSQTLQTQHLLTR
ncbi:MAG: hypothetical protein AAFQ20_04150 [Bacteroidota bacterium]